MKKRDIKTFEQAGWIVKNEKSISRQGGYEGGKAISPDERFTARWVGRYFELHDKTPPREIDGVRIVGRYIYNKYIEGEGQQDLKNAKMTIERSERYREITRPREEFCAQNEFLGTAIMVLDERVSKILDLADSLETDIRDIERRLDDI